MKTIDPLLELALRERQLQEDAAFYLWVIQKVAREIMDRPAETTLQKEPAQRKVAA